MGLKNKLISSLKTRLEARRNRFDERQRAMRARIGYESFALLMILLGICWVWIPETTVLIKNVQNPYLAFLIAALYFIARCVWEDAIWPVKKTTISVSIKRLIVVLGFILFGAYTAFRIMHDGLEFNPEGSLAGAEQLVAFALALLVVLGCVALIKWSVRTKTDITQIGRTEFSNEKKTEDSGPEVE